MFKTNVNQSIDLHRPGAFGTLALAGAIAVFAGPAGGCDSPPEANAGGDTVAGLTKPGERVQATQIAATTTIQAHTLGTVVPPIVLSDTMTVTVRTGADDLRSSSHVFFSVMLATGAWSTEREISTGASPHSTFTVALQNWDGLDPCAKQMRLRLQQGSCFLCTSDNWDVDYVQVDYNPLFRPSFRMLTKSGYGRLTESGPTIATPFGQTPAGTSCLGGKVADCTGVAVDAAEAETWSTDSYCDNGQYGMHLVCSAFKFDDGRCGGLPPGWTCPAGYYNQHDGCDCNCGVWDPDCDVPGQTL
jgi:hypothetical protein